MPNHYLTVALCAREDEEGPSLAPLNGANLCELADPLPAALRGIASAHPSRYRLVHKKTGDVCDNTHANLDMRYWDRVNIEPEEEAELRATYGAVDWYDWQTMHWGTKWGTYQTSVQESHADGSPVLLTFQSAWQPPNEETLRKIEAYLRAYGLTNITWIGHDPYDGTTKVILVSAPAVVPQ